MSTKVGFIGLGEMGIGMAKNLATKGVDLTVFDVRPEPVEELKKMGAKSASTPKELAAATDVIFSMVRDNAQTEEVLSGKNGVFEGIKKGATLIISSTVSPSLCQKIAKEAAKKGVGVIDAPVSGAKARAADGTLTMMIGGDEALVKKMEPILAKMSANRFHLGGVGMGQVGKLGNNMILFGTMLSTTEGVAFAIKAGIPVKKFLDFVNVSTGSNWSAQQWEALTLLKKDHSPTATLHMMYKDLRLGLDYAKEIGVDLEQFRRFEKYDLWNLPE